MKKFFRRIYQHIKELGKLTPLALIFTFLPILGSTTLLVTAYPLGNWLRINWEIGAVLYFIGVVFFCGLSLLPTNVIGIVGGWSFGFELGLAVLIVAVVCAATVSFLLNSKITGETLPNVFEKYPKANAVYEALVEENFARTTLIIFLLRLSPAMPFALTNFLMASAKVPLAGFIIGTFFGMLPRSAAVTFAGSGLSELSFNNPQESWLLIFGIVATIISVIFISVIANRALDHLTQANSTAKTEIP